MSKVEEKLNELTVYLGSAKELPLTEMVLVDPKKVLALAEEIKNNLPKELAAAQALLKDSEQVVADARKRAYKEYLVAVARNEEILKNNDMVKEAREKKEKILEEAKTEANYYVDSTLEWVDSKFLEMQRMLEKNLEATKTGRSELKRFKIQK
ncbi:MAG: hypothetical protein PHD88_04860 [Firmicutes bacterium]|nr:hypothetical protein [Bacillota bacterium]MDD4263401.1 hypothetical protein [Bacillota bacterium]MDD4693716.1 hypothetical protein [Bacillota bacterium]